MKKEKRWEGGIFPLEMEKERGTERGERDGGGAGAGGEMEGGSVADGRLGRYERKERAGRRW